MPASSYVCICQVTGPEAQNLVGGRGQRLVRAPCRPLEPWQLSALGEQTQLLQPAACRGDVP